MVEYVNNPCHNVCNKAVKVLCLDIQFEEFKIVVFRFHYE